MVIVRPLLISLCVSKQRKTIPTTLARILLLFFSVSGNFQWIYRAMWSQQYKVNQSEILQIQKQRDHADLHSSKMHFTSKNWLNLTANEFRKGLYTLKVGVSVCYAWRSPHLIKKELPLLSQAKIFMISRRSNRIIYSLWLGLASHFPL